MRIILSLIILCFLTSCSGDDSPTENEQQITPTIENISPSSANIGDIITIYGQNFKTNETYIVRFNGEEGEIIEITSTSLKVEIPEAATSGNITLEYNNQTTTIGTIEIAENPANSVYLFKRNYENGEERVFLTYDLNSETETIVTAISSSDYFENFSSLGGDISSVYYSATNEVIALVDFNTLLRINVADGSISTSVLSTDNFDQYKGLTVDAEANLYLFKRNYENGEERPIIKYSLDSSTETIITTLSSSDYFENFSSNGGDISSVYYSDTNEVIALVDFNTLLRINVADGSISTTVLSTDNFDQYKGLTVDAASNLYLFKRNYENGEERSFIKYTLDSSTETVVTTLSSSDYFENFSSNGGDISSVYSTATNEVIALVDFNTLLKINVTDGSISTSILSTNNFDQYKGLTME